MQTITRPGYATWYRSGVEQASMLAKANAARLKCILKCAFSLNEEEAHVLSYLITRGRGAIAKDIAEALGRNPEVVRRALRGLHAKSLVVRRPYPLRRGGRAYFYEVPDHIVAALTEVCEKVGEVIELVNNNRNGGSRAG
ncbi:hypothetical protein CF15_03010 [Pyrodictium occultum]|uniref:TrmB family transcriptional regulator n=1 Tax=Pyrodictium occultum TaxID=2309 RepID=A0A0V8RUR7_PYROC|nr:MarR family transcriptional regulator [Pyrodictium occultum]KSW11790.1 hypothetical protein CF15_03010 [Pyrodictium occultum]